MDERTHRRSLPEASYRAIAILFFLSGLCGLVYEILWARYLTLFLGSTTTACSIVLAVFMGGLALGYSLIGRLADRRRDNLALFGWLQITIGVYGALFPLIWKGLSGIYLAAATPLAGTPSVLTLLQALCSITGILFPAFLMGGTLPVLMRYLTRDISEVRHNVSLLYYVNSLGGVAGCLLVGMFLIKTFGVTSSNLMAAGLSLAIGVAALILSRIHRAAGFLPEDLSPQTAEEGNEGHGQALGNGTTEKASGSRGIMGRIVLICIALSGFTAMTYEIAWTRLFSIVLGASTYAFPIMLAAFIFGISLGSMIIAKRKALRTDPYFLFGLCELGIFISVLLSIPVYQWLPYAFLDLNMIFGRTTASFALFQMVTFVFCFLIMLVPTIFFGMALPLASIVYAGEVEHVGSEVGTVFAFDTAGGVAGALVAGLLLIPSIGLRHTIEVGFVINLVIGLVVFFIPSSRGGILKKAFVGALSLLVVFYVAFFPEWDRHMMNAGAGRFTRREPLTFQDYLEDSRQAEILFYKEGRGATVSVERKLGVKTLLINSKPEASTLGDMPTQMLIGHLPLILSRGIEDVLVIGIGSGITIGSVLTHPVGGVDCVEISEAVYDASRFFAPENREYWKDGRVRVYIEDAKHFVKTAPRRYDVIISEPSNPWVSVVGDLFSSKNWIRLPRGCYKSTRGTANIRGCFLTSPMPSSRRRGRYSIPPALPDKNRSKVHGWRWT